MTGFRVGLTGHKAILILFLISPLWARSLAEVLPVGALGGRAEIMSYLAPEKALSIRQAHCRVIP